MKKRFFSIFTALALLFSTLPVNALAVGNSGAGGLCEHHPSHTAECGYAEGAEGTPCNHEHTEDCYTLVEKCVHEHTDECYPEESVSGNTATPGNAEEQEPTECAHECSEATGCIKEKLDCQHEHDNECGYTPATKGTPCTFVCEICGEESTEQEENTKAKDAKCICEALCTGEKVNADCPVCGVEDADLTLCKGEPEQAQHITITSFDELPEEVQAQIIPAKTKLADLNLPDKLGVSGYVGTQDSGDAEQLTIGGVEWESDPAYDENAEQGAWLFAAKLPEGYTLLDGVELPQIGVMAEPVNLLAEVTAPGGRITADSTAEEIKSYFGNAATVDSSTKTITLTQGAVITLSALIRFYMSDWELDLNGATLKGGENSTTLYIRGGTLTITGSGTVDGSSTNTVGCTGVDVSDGALCIAEGVTLTAIGGNGSTTGREAIYVSSGTVTGQGTIHATGGSGGKSGGDGIKIYNGTVSCGNLTAQGGRGTIGGAGVSMHYSSSLIVAETLMASGGANDTDGTKKDISVNPYNYGGSSTISAGELVGSIDTGSDICSVTFEANNGTTGSLLQFVKKDGKVEAPETPTNGGHPFLGWFKDDGTVWNFESDTVTENLTLTAHWKKSVLYLDCNASGQNWEEKTCTNYTKLDKDDSPTDWQAGWYVVDGSVTLPNRVTVNGEVHLILADNCTLTASKGITVNDGNSLTIYAQSQDETEMGRLTATATNNNCAGIGGGSDNDGTDGGIITIYGGKIDATGGTHGAGIGGGGNSDGGSTTIYGGIVNAKGGESSAGIGGGNGVQGDSPGGKSGTVIIRGGDVTATGDGYGAGIGTGTFGVGGDITISGGTVDAKSGSSAEAAIGGDSVTVNISGGVVTAAYTGSNGAGIGGGANSITISGGFVTATGGSHSNSVGGIDGNFSTTTQGNAVIVTDKITGQVDESSLSGIIIVGWEGQLYGQNVTPTDDFTIPRNKELTILEGSTLTIKDGITAINEGTIYKYGAIDGTITNGNDGTILEKSSITVSVSGSSSGDSIPEALYGDSFYVNAVVGKADKNRAAYEGSVTFYVEMDGKKISLGLANVQNGKARQYVNMTGGQWKDKWWKPGDYTITAEFQNSDTLIKNNGQVILKITCDHTKNTNTTDNCTQEVNCSICIAALQGQENHSFENWISNNDGTHMGKDCTNKTCTGGVCTQTKTDDCSGGTPATCTQKAICDKCNAEYGVLAAHRMTYHAAQAATCTSAGNVEYRSCNVCGKNFADADGKTELQEVTIPELKHDWDAWKANNNGTHSRTCKRNSSHTETDSCSFGADDTCTICGGNKPVVTYTVTFDSQGGSPVGSQTITSGGKAAEPANPEKKGFTFAGWYNGGTKWDFAKDTVTGDLTLTAHWTADTPTPAEKYSVTVQTNGNGTASASPSSAEVGATIILTAAPNSGYHFKEWQVVSGNVTISGNSFKMPANDVTIQAIFEKNSSSGGNTGGSSGGGNSGGGSTVIGRPTEKHPDIPTTSETKPVKPDNGGKVAIGSDSIQDAINKATTDANKKGNKDKGIAVTVPVNNASDTKTLTITIPAETLDKLVAAKVRRFDITTNGLPSFSFTLDTLEMLDQQSLGGDLILRLAKTTVTSKQAKEAVGTRPAYDITLVFVKDGKETPFTDWQGRTISVKLPYTPAKDEQTGNLYAVYVDAKGKVEWLAKSSYNANQKAVIFEASHFSIYGVGYKNPAPVFTDITGHWAADNIIFAASRGLLAGTGNNQFSPNTGMTRGMFVTALGRLAGIDPESYKTGKFTDVKADAYYAPYVNWAAEKGIVSGTSATTFSPDTNITREQMAVIMAGYAKKMGYDLPVAHEAVTFVDNAQISSWAAKEVKAMQQAGIMAGKGGNRFDPKGTATRAEVATVLRRFVEIVIDPQTAQGWVQDHSGSWQYMKDGKAVTGWLYDDKKWYWLDKNGRMFASGWKQIDGKWYYFYSDGSMAVNTTIDGHTIGPDGARK